MAVVLAIRLGRSPSLLLMPLAFGAHAGSLLLLTGTPINVIVSDAAADAGLGGFGFFEFALVGVPLLLGTLAIVVLFGARLLPHRSGKSIPPDFSDYARTMIKHYRLPEGLVHLRVEHGSPLIGRPRDELSLTPYPGAELVGVHASGGGPATDAAFNADDVLVLRGAPTALHQLADANALAPYAGPRPPNGSGSLISGEVGVAELMIPPRSEAIGMGVFPGMVASNGELVILAIQRQGEDLGPLEITLAAGDTLLVQGTWGALAANEDDADVVVVEFAGDRAPSDGPDGPGRPPGHRGAVGNGGAAGDRSCARGGRGFARRQRPHPARRSQRQPGVPRYLVDDDRAAGRHHPAFQRTAVDWRARS